MRYPPTILMDSSILLAYYNARDNYHQPAKNFFENCTSDLLTTIPCITEVMYLLDRNWQVQNQFLRGVNLEVFAFVPLLAEDLLRIAELNQKYSDLPGDFADLSLVVISERLNIDAIATLDDDFYVYQRYRNQAFNRVFLG
ncbi:MULTISPECIES: PIN domain-containing protein [Spirulina sp. CCY15215]|uniref:type II toxin-antitoxin system VapC family toxin n=1 Tax=Spirulina sp. CCY15215 TaxID=2767591 RepID=UPI001950CDF4|nr:PIN domain-containing protein [Spirulina major]